MAYRQYTQCEEPGDYVDLSFTAIGFRNIIIMILSGGFAAWLIAVFIGGPGALMAAIALFASLVAYLYWWLNGRLICLDGERCLIGMVRTLSAADPLEKGGDDDFSMNVMLAPGPTAFRTDFGPDGLPGPPPPVSDYQGALQGVLVSEQASILAIGRAYVTDEGHLTYMTGLHCEFEGSGIRNLMIWAGIVLALLIAALAVDLLGGPGLGWLVKLLIMLAIFFGGVGALTGPLAGPLAAGAGHPTDVDPSLATLARGDIIVLKGIWVYDSLHHGWNEIHPIRDCCVIGKTTIGGPWPTDLGDGLGLDTNDKVKVTLDRWCRMLDDARTCEEGGSRDNPVNDWILHPLVDGCQESVVIL